MIALLSNTLTRVVGEGTVFRYKISGGEHPVSQRKIAESALADYWGGRKARVLNPQPELLTVTLNKMKREKSKGLVLVPSCAKVTQCRN